MEVDEERETQCENAKWLSPRTQINSEWEKRTVKFLVWQSEREKSEILSLCLSVRVTECLLSCQLNFHTQRFATNAHTHTHSLTQGVCVRVRVCLCAYGFKIILLFGVDPLAKRQRLCVKRSDKTNHTIESWYNMFLFNISSLLTAYRNLIIVI